MSNGTSTMVKELPRHRGCRCVRGDVLRCVAVCPNDGGLVMIPRTHHSKFYESCFNRYLADGMDQAQAHLHALAVSITHEPRIAPSSDEAQELYRLELEEMGWTPADQFSARNRHQASSLGSKL